MKKIKGITFQPYYGPNYETGKYGKLLLLGESHYLNEEVATSKMTSEVIQNALEETGFKSPFFKNTGKLFNDENWKELYENIAFANLIQTGLRNSKSQPDQE